MERKKYLVASNCRSDDAVTNDRETTSFVSSRDEMFVLPRGADAGRLSTWKKSHFLGSTTNFSSIRRGFQNSKRKHVPILFRYEEIALREFYCYRE